MIWRLHSSGTSSFRPFGKLLELQFVVSVVSHSAHNAQTHSTMDFERLNGGATKQTVISEV